MKLARDEFITGLIIYFIFAFFPGSLLGEMRMSRPVPSGNIKQDYLYGEWWGGYVHYGVDFVVVEGTPVYSAVSGTVDHVDTGWANTYPNGPYTFGNHVRIKSLWKDHTFYTYYAHLSIVSVKLNQPVLAGETVVGLSGNSGYSSGAHMHFEIREDSTDPTNSRNPEVFMETKNKEGGVVVGFVPGVPIGTAVKITPNPKSGSGFQYASIYRPHANPDDIYKENFAIGDLPPGTYTLICGDTYTRTIVISLGEVTNAEAPLPPTGLKWSNSNRFSIDKSYDIVSTHILRLQKLTTESRDTKDGT